jgi:hypothetical protein
MNKATKMHLENVTPENLESWREEDSFSSFASATSKKGFVNIGVNGKGTYFVSLKGDVLLFNTAKEAVERYTELVSD